jgi:hypothetical protein
VSCSRVRRELLEHFRFRGELGIGSAPHLVHLQSCADCRQEVGIDRDLVEQLRRALQERVEGSAPSASSWEAVRRRTVDRPARQWAVRVRQWSGMLPAAVAGIMMFAVATASETGLINGNHTPTHLPDSAGQEARLREGASAWPAAWRRYGFRASEPVLHRPSGPVDARDLQQVVWSGGEKLPTPAGLRTDAGPA